MNPDITGLVLAGGRGLRMGGVDKGLQEFNGTPLALHALQRLRPQVGSVLINANRHHDAYRAWGVPVLADASADFAGPMAGVLAGLQHCTTPWLLAVPCDAPWFPLDLASRLAAAAAREGAQAAVAQDRDAQGQPRLQPVFCLVHVSLRESLQAWLDGGGRRARDWLQGQHTATQMFDGPGDAQAFFNANTPQDLA
ncbi:MAG: molybdenum cofactor guanylyltransferase MobA [Proteobacteria bacterium]|jgi:molybdopterin-guanine dinucleotide biosynthesis protein A|nr:molybdenum cofactor guanylyltransferase MobA [Ramlibacter sp.]MCA0213325.1 molybdenum cofactor guanylyltransferase MobA [Pseudomonadota bacterium]